MIRAGTADTTIKVAPLVGAWIEIQMQKLSVEVLEVAPLVGAWIEIKGGYNSPELLMSRPPSRSADFPFARVNRHYAPDESLLL